MGTYNVPIETYICFKVVGVPTGSSAAFFVAKVCHNHFDAIESLNTASNCIAHEDCRCASSLLQNLWMCSSIHWLLQVNLLAGFWLGCPITSNPKYKFRASSVNILVPSNHSACRFITQVVHALQRVDLAPVGALLTTNPTKYVQCMLPCRLPMPDNLFAAYLDSPRIHFQSTDAISAAPQ